MNSWTLRTSQTIYGWLDEFRSCLLYLHHDVPQNVVCDQHLGRTMDDHWSRLSGSWSAFCIKRKVSVKHTKRKQHFSIKSRTLLKNQMIQLLYLLDIHTESGIIKSYKHRNVMWKINTNQTWEKWLNYYTLHKSSFNFSLQQLWCSFKDWKCL